MNYNISLDFVVKVFYSNDNYNKYCLENIIVNRVKENDKYSDFEINKFIITFLKYFKEI